MSRRRRGGGLSTLRCVLGLLIAPTAIAIVFVSVLSLGDLTAGASGAHYFLSAFAGYAVLHVLRCMRLYRFYVFAHECTHALAAWATGGKVFSFVVRKQSGYVDLSHSNAFIALAPYWVPLYALLSVAAYRLVLWWGAPPYAREVFLALMGASLAFHFSHTVEALWVTHQSDLDEAGFLFSMALIVFLNGVLLLAAVKCLFPQDVSLADSVTRVAEITRFFWQGLWIWGGRCVQWAMRAVS